MNHDFLILEGDKEVGRGSTFVDPDTGEIRIILRHEDKVQCQTLSTRAFFHAYVGSGLTIKFEEK